MRVVRARKMVKPVAAHRMRNVDACPPSMPCHLLLMAQNRQGPWAQERAHRRRPFGEAVCTKRNGHVDGPFPQERAKECVLEVGVPTRQSPRRPHATLRRLSSTPSRHQRRRAAPSDRGRGNCTLLRGRWQNCCRTSSDLSGGRSSACHRLVQGARATRCVLTSLRKYKERTLFFLPSAFRVAFFRFW